MAVVIDASAAMSIVRGEEDGMAIKELILQGEEIFAPDLFRLEIASGFWKYVNAGYMEKNAAMAYYNAACDLPTRYVRQNDLVSEVLQEAIRLNHSVYDITYLVLARRLSATFASLDRKLIELCESQGIDCVGTTDEGLIA